MALGLATERWSNGGLWVISRGDEVYPQRLPASTSAAALLRFCGAWAISTSPARRRSRSSARATSTTRRPDGPPIWRPDAPPGLTSFSRRRAQHDQIAMSSALDAGGRVIAVLPEGLGKPSVTAKYRESILGGRLLLLSTSTRMPAFRSATRWGEQVIYGLADAAAIVRADAHKGGTWAGAEEELRREIPDPLFVRASEPMPDGNRALIARGARPFPDDDGPARVRSSDAPKTRLRHRSRKPTS